MPDLFSEIVPFLAWSSAQLLLLGVVVLSIHRISRAGSAFVRPALGLLVLLPFLSLGAWLLPAPAWLTVRTPLVADTDASPQAESVTDSTFREVVSPGDAVALTATESAASFGAPAAHPDVRAVLGGIWFAGVLLLLAGFGYRVLALRGALRATRAIGDRRVRLLLSRCAEDLSVSEAPALRASDECAVPFLVGLLRPTIVVPARLLAPTQHEALRFALLHEIAHLKHRDHRWIAPETLLSAAYFFHPVVRVALSRLQEERECRADRVVARVCGRRAAYADFLLDEIETTRSRVPPAPALALGRGPGSMARRIRRLLDLGESKMKHSVRHHVAVALTGTALLCLLGVAAGPITADDAPPRPHEDPRYGSINAVSTDEEGVYRVHPVFEELIGIHIVPKGGPYDKEHRRELKAGSDYAFDASKGLIRFSVPIDTETDHVSVHGYRVLPWRWNLGRPFAPGSVKVAFKDREAERGVDYEVDDAAGTIRFLKKELCGRKQQYSITYRHPVDPEHPELAQGGMIGTFVPPPKSGTVTTGRGPAPAAPKHLAEAVGTNASATSDPRTWTLTQPVRSDGVRIAVAKRGTPGDLRWLERGTDYVYDPALGKIVLNASVRIDGETEYLFVHGVPADRGLVLRHRPIGEETVKVVVGDRRLVEGTGFEVDRPAGRVRILDEAIRTPRAQFYVQVGAWSFGSYTDRDALKRLLAD